MQEVKPIAQFCAVLKQVVPLLPTYSKQFYAPKVCFFPGAAGMLVRVSALLRNCPCINHNCRHQLMLVFYRKCRNSSSCYSRTSPHFKASS